MCEVTLGQVDMVNQAPAAGRCRCRRWEVSPGVLARARLRTFLTFKVTTDIFALKTTGDEDHKREDRQNTSLNARPWHPLFNTA
jgi:hypothetical protein